MEKAEATSQPPAVVSHRLPEGRVAGVVVHHDHFVVGICESVQGIESGYYDIGRLGVDRDVERDLRMEASRQRLEWISRPHPDIAAEDLAVPERLHDAGHQYHEGNWERRQHQVAGQRADGHGQDEGHKPGNRDHK